MKLQRKNALHMKKILEPLTQSSTYSYFPIRIQKQYELNKIAIYKQDDKNVY